MSIARRLRRLFFLLFCGSPAIGFLASGGFRRGSLGLIGRLGGQRAVQKRIGNIPLGDHIAERGIVPFQNQKPGVRLNDKQVVSRSVDEVTVMADKERRPAEILQRDFQC